ncbi:MAG: hypothetical protein LC121_25500 [Anaerolineae bacterium]|nr:hypothetical protein [Anaerolineae bacterium]
MHWHRSPEELYRRSRLRERAGEPFTPRVPRLVSDHPTLSGAALAVAGVAGNWFIVSRMAGWPNWMVFPSMLLATIAAGDGADCAGRRPLAGAGRRADGQLGRRPGRLARSAVGAAAKAETLGYWSADDICRAVEDRRFQWTALELTERRLVEQAVAFRDARTRGRGSGDGRG